MARTVPQMSGRLPLFEKLERHSGGTVVILDDGVRKSIPDFERYSKDYETSFDAVKRAYAAAKAAAKEAAAQGRQPFMISATTGPQLEGRRKTYLVETTPLGYYKEPSTVREARALALACCETARVLHAEGVVHRDFRLPNVVCLGPRTSDEDSLGTEVGTSGGNDEDLAFLVIDLEGAAEEGAEVSPDCGLALASRDGVLDENGTFTAASDMFEIGMVLQSILRQLGAYHGESKAFVRALKRKELSALEALDHPWLRGLGN
ncbi:hypothetical protein KFL_009700040 [Klebsormidium nitens]|uniref:Protein kinase domain-containing protein n=1 Tax=Klebsormidium nitens TaxID=105231 RepID=A0A1Y1IUE5_KLENI|nr:hypothetical protein KFL_009700040 [Klebsormidium nitens]|eukprot:GAQ92297.1 hypothetical protein KFL_009700040 [Klebsormidium nitens]